VILGPGFSHHEALQAVLSDKFTVKFNVPSLIEEMAKHGLAITAGGITPFEANAAGLPCIVVACEDFEIPIARALAERGGSVFAGHHADIDPDVFAQDLPIGRMSAAGIDNIGLGGAKRVVTALEALLAA
jgi:spore coat polysaccharide biosynthesis predicted glycosyltransferase SpsG